MKSKSIYFNLVQNHCDMERESYITSIRLYENKTIRITNVGKAELIYESELPEDDVRDINGVTWIEDMLFYTKEGSNYLYKYHIIEGTLAKIELPVADDIVTVEVVKNVINPNSHTREIIVKTQTKKQSPYFTFSILDIDAPLRLYPVPFNRDVVDLARRAKDDSTIVGFGEMIRCLDIDFLEFEYDIFIESIFDQRIEEFALKKKIAIVEGESDTFTGRKYSQSRVVGDGWKVPLEKLTYEFNTYWNDDCVGCISSNGNYVVLFYGRFRIPTILVASIKSMDAKFIFEMPKELQKKGARNFKYCFNEEENILVCTSDSSDLLYSIKQENPAIIKELNHKYNAFLLNKAPDNAVRGQLERLYYRMLDSTKIELLRLEQ